MNSSNENKELEVQHKDLTTVFIEYSNYILIVALVMINILIGLVVVEDGSIKINDFKDYLWLDWVLWVILTFIPPIISVIVRTIFQKEGISKAKLKYPKLISDYFKYVKNDTQFKVRSEKEYLSEKATKKMMSTLLLTLIISFFSGSIIYGFDKTGVMRLSINTITTLIVGFLAFTSSYSFGVTELKSWYILEIERLSNLEYDKMVASGKYIVGGK